MIKKIRKGKIKLIWMWILSFFYFNDPALHSITLYLESIGNST